MISIACFSQNAGDVIVHFTFEGNANDVSGNVNNAVVHGATLTADRFGTPNSAYDFDGQVHYIEFPASATMSQVFTTKQITISAWINIRAWYNNWNVIPIIEQYNAETDMGSLLLEANWASGGVGFIAGYKAPWIGANYTWVFKSWHNITVTYYANIGSVSFCIAGKLIAAKSYSESFTPDHQNPFVIGRSLSGPDEYSNGVIDDIIIYKKALTAEEVKELVNQTATDNKEIIQNTDKISLSPNPATTYFTIQGLEKETTLTVYNIHGKIVLEKRISPDDKVDVGGWNKGVYFVKTENGTGKLIIR